MTQTTIFHVADLNPKKAIQVSFIPEPDVLQDMALALGVIALRKLRLTGTLSARGKSDWYFEGSIGVTAVQNCVVTLVPINTRIEEKISRHFIADWTDPDDAEAEMSADDALEPLEDRIDLLHVTQEAIALALPPYPRAQDADLGSAVFAEPGVEPLTDEDSKPFAGLASLRDKLQDD